MADGAEHPGWAIATTGNCQGLFVASAFDSLPGVTAEYFGNQGRYLPFAGSSAAPHPADELRGVLERWRAEGRRVVLCEQVWPIAPPLDLATLDGLIEGCVRFPNLESFTLWPDRKYSPEQRERLTPARMLRLDVAAGPANQAADIDMRDVYADRFRAEITFDTSRHPSALVLASMIGRMAALPPLASIPGVADLESQVAASRGINTRFKHPIDPAIAEALDLTWARTEPYTTWRAAVAAFDRGDTTEAKRLTYGVIESTDDPFFVSMIKPYAYAALASVARPRRSDEWQEWDSLVDATIAADPDNSWWYDQFARFAAKRDRRAAARAIVDRGLAIMPGNTDLLRLLAETGIKAAATASA